MGKNWKRLAVYLRFGLPGLILSLALACASASAPATPEPLVSAGAPVVDGADQAPREAAAGPATPTPAPTRAPKAITEETPSTENADPGRLSGPASGYGAAFSTVKGRDETSELALPKDGANDQAMPIPDKGELQYPKLGSHLDRLVAAVDQGELSAAEAAAGAAMYSEESVAVTIHLSGSVDGMVSFLEDNGADPRNVGEDYIEAYVPAPLLGQVSQRPGVLRVRQIIPPGPNS